MPMNPYKAALQSRITENELLKSFEERQQEVFFDASRITRWPRSHSKTYEAMKYVVGLFEQSQASVLEATCFDSELSPNRKQEVKRLLGIRSLRIKGSWWWTKPKRTVDGAIALETVRTNVDIEKVRHKITQLRRPAADRLVACMRRHNWDGIGAVILMETGYNRQTVLRMKSLLGIVSYKNHESEGGDGLWHWAYPEPTVVDWFGEICTPFISTADLSKLADSRGYTKKFQSICLSLVPATLLRVEGVIGYASLQVRNG